MGRGESTYQAVLPLQKAEAVLDGYVTRLTAGEGGPWQAKDFVNLQGTRLYLTPTKSAFAEPNFSKDPMLFTTYRVRVTPEVTWLDAQVRLVTTLEPLYIVGAQHVYLRRWRSCRT